MYHVVPRHPEHTSTRKYLEQCFLCILWMVAPIREVSFVSLRQIALGAVVGFVAFDMFSLMHLSSFFNPERTLPNFYEDALRQTVGPKWQLLPPRMLAVFHIGLD